MRKLAQHRDKMPASAKRRQNLSSGTSLDQHPRQIVYEKLQFRDAPYGRWLPSHSSWPKNRFLRSPGSLKDHSFIWVHPHALVCGLEERDTYSAHVTASDLRVSCRLTVLEVHSGT